MRKLKRAHQRHVRERKKFKKRAVAAGTAAAITLGSGVCLHKALAAYIPDLHELVVSQDVDADLLANAEEVEIGYHAFKGDQNRNEIPDGVELAKPCAAIINQLPVWEYPYEDPEPNEVYKTRVTTLGQELCDICGAAINMGGVRIVNPTSGLSYPNDPYDFLPYMAVHYMEHGSFSFSGTTNSGRADVMQLLTVLELQYQYLYDPNEHQLSVGNDSDGDLLTDSEEAATGYDPNSADQDNDLVPDGIELAKQCAEVIEGLPVEGVDPVGDDEVYKESFLAGDLEYCDICEDAVNMGFWRVKNPQLGLSIDVHEIACHYMVHGSFSYAGSVHHSGRIDVEAFLEVLEMPRRCGDLGTTYLSGDLDENCLMDMSDIRELTKRWLKDCNYFGTPYVLGDISGDCDVNLIDFATLAGDWQESTDPNR
ncbi:MAG: hypothetical protein JSV82_00335 [Planctomycetota bacterium]|nr:MAG: hypothetical protein JSV82_00335 [Planctomycetota bacterium]